MPRADLDALLGGAAAVAFPSRYEGFGNGVLEAMARGVPVVAAGPTADASLPEVLGGAGRAGRARRRRPAWAEALARVLTTTCTAPSGPPRAGTGRPRSPTKRVPGPSPTLSGRRRRALPTPLGPAADSEREAVAG